MMIFHQYKFHTNIIRFNNSIIFQYNIIDNERKISLIKVILFERLLLFFIKETSNLRSIDIRVPTKGSNTRGRVIVDNEVGGNSTVIIT